MYSYIGNTDILSWMEIEPSALQFRGQIITPTGQSYVVT